MNSRLKRWIAAISGVSMTVTALPLQQAYAAELQPAVITPTEFDGETPNLHAVSSSDSAADQTDSFDPDETVRATVLLQMQPAMDVYDFSLEEPDDPEIVLYRQELEREQQQAADAIEEQVLDGESLDVRQNLTLALNGISVEVTRAQLEQIESLDFVSGVEIEPSFDALDDQTADPTMVTSPAIDGIAVMQAAGYKGAGTRIAIIDTGLNTDHISFNNDAYLEQLRLHAAAKGLSLSAYKEQLDLLDDAEIESVKSVLHLPDSSISAADLSVSEKIPYAFNYIDKDLDAGHENDSSGDHGSHVAGISAANELLPNSSGGFVSASDGLNPSGAAPDAQVLVMKVFGRAGGAYAADYFAAVEDAITLGCDSINMSIGSSNSGYSFNETYQEAFEKMKNSKAVVSVSAANNGSWASKTSLEGKLYKEDVSFHNVGDPGSYSDALTVASIENTKYTSCSLSVGGLVLFYKDATTKLPLLSSIAGSSTYFYHPTEITGSETRINNWDITGKIAVVKTTRQNADAVLTRLGSKNPKGIILMLATEELLDTSLKNFSVPTAVLMNAYDYCFAKGTQLSDGSWTGSINVSRISSVDIYGNKRIMSSFSSWGVLESLELKPEITAPGGNIYSVDGLDPSNSAFRNRSGTSMAAPQIAGMSVLLAQRIEEEGLEAKTGKTARQISQSLLMSTAEPIKNSDKANNYWPVLQQGAGLARVDYAASAKSILFMNDNATKSAADGKIKAELGEDPQKQGTYSFGFSMQSLQDQNCQYTLSGSFFTQALSEDGEYLLPDTTPLDASISVSGGSSFTLGANQTKNLTVTISLSNEQKRLLNEQHPNGAYIEGFVTITQNGSGSDVTHSIPFLAYYGSWSDPSMYEPVTYYSQSHGDTTLPYMSHGATAGAPISTNVLEAVSSKDSSRRYLAGNPYLEGDTRDEDRSAIAAGELPAAIYYSPIRNASVTGATVISEEGDVVYATNPEYSKRAGWKDEHGIWQDTRQTMNLSLGSSALASGSTYEVSLLSVSEYYTQGMDLKAEGIIESLAKDSRIHSGAKLSTTVHVDTEKPKVISVSADTANDVMNLQMSDNFNVAYLAIYNDDKSEKLYECIPADDTNGSAFTERVDQVEIEPGEILTVVVGDYARNETAVRIQMPADELFKLQLAGSAVSGMLPGALEGGKEAVLNFEAAEGYQLPQSISVTVGGTELAAGDYTWNPATGRLVILEGKVTGDVVVTINSERKQYAISFSGEGFEDPGTVTAAYHSNFSITLTPKAGYTFPAEIEVRNSAGQLIDAEQYLWSQRTGRLAISYEAITQNLSVRIQGTKASYTIRTAGTGIQSKDPVTAEYGQAVSLTLQPLEGYSLPAAVSLVYSSTQQALETSQYSWNAATGVLSLKAGALTGNIQITANASPILHQVTFSGQGIADSGTTFVSAYGSQAVMQISVLDGYQFPASITVRRKSGAVVPTSSYDWNPVSGQLTLLEGTLTEDLDVIVNAEKIVVPVITHQVSVKGTGIENQQSIALPEGQDLRLTISPADGYMLPEKIEIRKKTGNILVPASDYTWDQETGVLTMRAAKASDDLEITVDAQKAPEPVVLDTSLLVLAMRKADSLDLETFLLEGQMMLEDSLVTAERILENPQSQQEINQQARRINSSLLALRKRTDQPLP